MNPPHRDPLAAIERARHPAYESLLLATSDLLVNDGLDAVSLTVVANHAHVPRDTVQELFGSVDQLLNDTVEREYGLVFALIVDNIDRDPLGGLLSHIYRHMMSAVSELPLARTLFQSNPEIMSRILGSQLGYPAVAQLTISIDLIDKLKKARIVRDDVNSAELAALLSTISAGAAVVTPMPDPDLVSRGLVMMLERAVDADVKDASNGKAVFLQYMETRVRSRSTLQ